MQVRTGILRLGGIVGLGSGGAALCLLYFLYFGSSAAWLPFFNVYLIQSGLSSLQIGVLASMRPVAMLLSQPLWGVAADLWGRRRTLLLGMLLAALLLLGYTLGRTFQFFILWTLLYSLLSNPVGALIDSLVLDHIEGRADLSYGRLRMWGAIGWGIMASLVGYAITGRETRLIFIFGAATMLVGWLVALRGTRAHTGGGALRRDWSGLGALLRNRRLLVFLALITLLQTGAASIFTFFPVYMDELGATSRMLGLAYTLQGLGELPFYFGAAAIMRRIGARRTLVFAILVFAARVFLYAAISRPALAMLVELSHGLSFALFLVASIDYVNSIVPSTWRATGQSLFWTAYFGAGSILGNAWAGFLTDRIGVRQMFGTNGWLILLVAVVAAVVLRERAAEAPDAPGTEIR